MWQGVQKVHQDHDDAAATMHQCSIVVGIYECDAARTDLTNLHAGGIAVLLQFLSQVGLPS